MLLFHGNQIDRPDISGVISKYFCSIICWTTLCISGCLYYVDMLATLLVHTSGPLKCSSGLRLRLLDCCVSPWYTCVRELWSVGRLVGWWVGKLNLVPPVCELSRRSGLCFALVGPLFSTLDGRSRIMWWLSFGCFVGGGTDGLERTEPQRKGGRFFSDVGGVMIVLLCWWLLMVHDDDGDDG